MFIYKRCKCGTKSQSRHSENDFTSLAGLLKLLAVPSRLSILNLLGSGPHCVCDIETHSKMSQTLISHHLSDLAKTGLIQSEKNGQFTDYSLTQKGGALVAYLKKLNKI